MSGAGWLAFLVAAALGASLRYAVGNLIVDRSERAIPWGTLAINASGSLLAGVIAGRSVVLGTGFCGAYTTFSTFTFETVQLIEQGEIRRAVANGVAMLSLCAVAAAAGLAMSTR